MRLVPRRAGVFLIAAVASTACGGAKSTPATAAAEPETLALAGIVGQNIIVAPVQGLWISPDLGWSPLPLARPTLARLDSALADTLRGRVGNQQWVFADGVDRAFRNNPTYATDPRALAANPLRASRLEVGDRLPEPLASQLRTMIALQDARLVLIPVELRIERTASALGRPVVRLVLVDPRSSVVRWIGKVEGADSPVYDPAFTATIAARVADLFVAK